MYIFLRPKKAVQRNTYTSFLQLPVLLWSHLKKKKSLLQANVTVHFPYLFFKVCHHLVSYIWDLIHLRFEYVRGRCSVSENPDVQLPVYAFSKLHVIIWPSFGKWDRSKILHGTTRTYSVNIFRAFILLPKMNLYDCLTFRGLLQSEEYKTKQPVSLWLYKIRIMGDTGMSSSFRVLTECSFLLCEDWDNSFLATFQVRPICSF